MHSQQAFLSSCPDTHEHTISEIAFTVLSLLGCAAANVDSECMSQVGHAPLDGDCIRALHALKI